ncbi:hypothetical protein RP20_CCG020997 [Aedes albopictus]|nr:hypothetical protein RP20_CCG020997 [Aedes albopictus]
MDGVVASLVRPYDETATSGRPLDDVNGDVDDDECGSDVVVGWLRSDELGNGFCQRLRPFSLRKKNVLNRLVAVSLAKASPCGAGDQTLLNPSGPRSKAGEYFPPKAYVVERMDDDDDLWGSDSIS